MSSFGPFQGNDRFSTRVSMAGVVDVADKLKVLEMANPGVVHVSVAASLPQAHVDALLAAYFGLWPTTPITQVYKALWARSCMVYYNSTCEAADKNMAIHQVYEKYRERLESERVRFEQLLGQMAEAPCVRSVLLVGAQSCGAFMY